MTTWYFDKTTHRHYCTDLKCKSNMTCIELKLMQNHEHGEITNCKYISQARFGESKRGSITDRNTMVCKII
jgi:hypothetical protein